MFVILFNFLVPVFVFGVTIVHCKFKRQTDKQNPSTVTNPTTVPLAAGSSIKTAKEKTIKRWLSDGEETTRFEITARQEKAENQKVRTEISTEKKESTEVKKLEGVEDVKKEDKTQKDQKTKSIKTAKSKRPMKNEKKESEKEFDAEKSPVISEKWEVALPMKTTEIKTAQSKKTRRTHRRHRGPSRKHRYKTQLSEEEKRDKDERLVEKEKRKRQSREHEDHDDDTLFEIPNRQMPNRVFNSEIEVRRSEARTQTSHSFEELQDSVQR
ncbi:hypothetical protein M3Y96_01165000 [Aphelenchoides besseyi]|nr:hypothetical protein M3Y96_01165000 [Aphelenchoides besseyi]